MKKYENVEEIIDDIVADDSLATDDKIQIFTGWKDKIAENMENVLMDKPMAEKYFSMLGAIDKGIARI